MRNDTTTTTSNNLADNLTAISVIAKLLARKVKEEEINEQDETNA